MIGNEKNNMHTGLRYQSKYHIDFSITFEEQGVFIVRTYFTGPVFTELFNRKR